MSEYLNTPYQKKVSIRYMQTKEDGNKEVLDDMFDRISLNNKAYRKMFEDKDGLPAGRICANVGGRGNNMVGNCFYIPILEDSLQAIMKCQTDSVLVFQKGGGKGTNFSILRPKNAPVQGAEHGSSGPCSFIDAQDSYAGLIKQGGDRRAAEMTILNIEHPDIREFIHAKTDHKRWSNTNVSVGISDKFMQAVSDDTDFCLEFGNKIYEITRATDLWNEICTCAWKSAEPGVIFLNTINDNFPLNYKYKIEGTNPCVSGDSIIHTSKGEMWATDIQVGDFIETIYGYEAVTEIEVTPKKYTYLVELKNGSSINVTESHVFYGYKSGELVPREITLRELNSGDFIVTIQSNHDKLFCISREEATTLKEGLDWKEYSVSEIKNITWNDGVETVYDFYCNGSDTYVVNGIVSRGCGEQPLPPFGMCLLGSVILPSFVAGGVFFERDFIETVKLMVRYLDELIDISTFPIPEVEEMVKKTRPIGLGATGLADMLFLMGLPYGDHAETLSFTDKLFEIMYTAAREASEELAIEKGCFPDYDPELAKFPARRNSTLLSFAPTGTISGMIGCSYGIEPHFAPSVVRNEDLGRDVVSNPVIDKYMEEYGLTELPEWARFVGGADEKYTLSVQDHLSMLKVIASHCDSAVSKTVNLPNNATVEDVSEVFMYCWKNGIKGVTVYRDGCREDQPVTWDSEKEAIEEDYEEVDVEFIDYSVTPKARPNELGGTTYKVKFNYNSHSMFITINDFEGDLYEIFFKINNSVHQEYLDGLSRAITTLWRRGIDTTHLMEEFAEYESLSGGSFYEYKQGKKINLKSILHAISVVVGKHVEMLETDVDLQSHKCMATTENELEVEAIKGEKCPDCGNYTVVRSEGCSRCINENCTYYKCG